MASTGKAFAHTIGYLLGMETAATQTTAAEREAIRQFAAGRKRGVEIGVFEGVSTCVIAESLAPDGELIGIDPFFKGRFGVCWGEIIVRHKLRRARLCQKVKLIKSVSQKALALVEGPFDSYSSTAITPWKAFAKTGKVGLSKSLRMASCSFTIRKFPCITRLWRSWAHANIFETLSHATNVSIL